MSITSDDDPDCNKVSDSEFDSELDSDVDMRMEDDVDAPDGVDLDGDVDMERDSHNEVEEDELEEDGEKDEDEYDGKEPPMIGQGNMVNTLADDVDTMVDDQPILLSEQCQLMRDHTLWPQPPAPASQPETLEPHQLPRTPENYPLSGLDHLWLVTPPKPSLAVPTLRQAVAARNTLDVDLDQRLLIKSAFGDSLSHVPLTNVPFSDVRTDGSVGEEWTSPRIAGEAMVVAFKLGSGSCLVHLLWSNLCISGIEYFTHHKVFGLLKVNIIYGFYTGFIFIGFCSFIVWWDIQHAAFLQLLVCKVAPFNGVEDISVSWKYRELINKATQAHHELSSLCTVYTPLLMCHWQCQRRPLSIAPNFHAKRCLPLTAGHFIISNYSIQNAFKMHTRSIWLFSAGPIGLNPLRVVNSTLTQIQSKTWTHFRTSNMLKNFKFGVSTINSSSAADRTMPLCWRSAERL